MTIEQKAKARLEENRARMQKLEAENQLLEELLGGHEPDPFGQPSATPKKKKPKQDQKAPVKKTPPRRKPGMSMLDAAQLVLRENPDRWLTIQQIWALVGKTEYGSVNPDSLRTELIRADNHRTAPWLQRKKEGRAVFYKYNSEDQK